MADRNSNRPFLWSPGAGYDEEALARMQRAFPRPKTPMGEAWFMGDNRRLFVELMGNLNCVAAKELFSPLYEIASGAHSFGPRAEWSSWFHYLLGRLVPRSHEGVTHYLLEPLITAFFSQYPSGIKPEPYRGFRADVLSTLGRCMMDASCWSGGQIVLGEILHRGGWPNGIWRWFDASGDFSASMFFCLKYLSAAEIRDWMLSVLRIPSPYWRAQVMVWFVGAHDMLTGAIKQPSLFEIADRPRLAWEASHLLTGRFATDDGDWIEIGGFLPDSNRLEALAALASYMSPDMFLDWMCSIAEFEELECELAELPERFYALYLSSARAAGNR